MAALLLAFAGQAAEPPRFPKPNPEQALAELKVFSPDGSPVRMPVEDWDGARRRVTSDPAWQRWLTEQRGEVDDWMARRQDRVEWVTGWWHDFVSPQDGSFLTWTPDEPGEETLSSPSDPRVKLTPKLHAAWVFGFRTRHAAKLAEAAQLFRLTGERRYADWTSSQLDFYATNYLRWPEKPGRGCRLMWQSLDEAVNLVRFVHAVRLLDDAVPVAQRQRWFGQFFRPQAEMLETTFQRVHNIACWHRSAVGHVALCFADDALWQKAVEAPFGIRQQLARGVTSDYLWFEQSLGYNSYVVSALRPFFEYAQMAGRGAKLRQEMAVLENLLLAPILLRFPTGQLPNPADSTGGPGRAPNVASLAASYRLFPTPLGLTEAVRRRDWNTLLDPAVPPASLPPLPAVPSRNLESSRMALLRRGDWQVFFHYGQLDASHAQAEALDYEVFLGDTPISHDPGTVGYGSPLHATYFTQGLAHNVPLVNGLGQAPWQPGELLGFDADRGYVAARQSRYRANASAERELHLDERSLIVVTRLALQADAGPAALGLALHFQGRVLGLEDFQPGEPFAASHWPAGFRYWREPRTASFTDRAALRVDCGDRRLEVLIEVPGGFRVSHALTPDVPPRQRESLYVETTGTAAVFRTTFRELTTQGAAVEGRR
ncbi:MAG: heparinase II/III family protein [Verrucomicrobiales bacterium]|nr:heparinase II/III family protein [Verrucomicrobiales bacterium]